MKNLLTGLFTIWNIAALAATPDLATAIVNEPGEWRPFSVGQLIAAADTGTGPSAYWKNAPGVLGATLLDFYFLTRDPAKKIAEDYSLIDFTVSTPGLVWILANARGSINKLQSEGWIIKIRGIQTEVGNEQFGKNTSIEDWVLMERQCIYGDRFSLRTETYKAPVVLRLRETRLQALKYRHGVVIEAIGNPGQYRLQSSADLKTWADEWPVTLGSIDSHLLTGSGVTPGTRFYRLMEVKP